MRCEYFEGCPVFKRGGEAACKRHFCNDTCPQIPDTATVTGTIATAATADSIGTTTNVPAKKVNRSHIDD